MVGGALNVSRWLARERVLRARSGRVRSELGRRGERTTHIGFTRNQEPPDDSVGWDASREVHPQECVQPDEASCSPRGGEKSGWLTNRWSDGGRCNRESRGMLSRQLVEWRWQNFIWRR